MGLFPSEQPLSLPTAWLRSASCRGLRLQEEAQLLRSSGPAHRAGAGAGAGLASGPGAALLPHPPNPGRVWQKSPAAEGI